MSVITCDLVSNATVFGGCTTITERSSMLPKFIVQLLQVLVVISSTTSSCFVRFLGASLSPPLSSPAFQMT
ncbi:MAG: hypothetical protein U0X74_03045 [Anaerolineales bacterium]